MGNTPLAYSPAQLLLAVVAGNLQFLLGAASPVLAFALQILSLISLVLIIIVNWRKIFTAKNEKSVSDD